MTTATPLTLLDACAVINFYATRHMDRVLATMPGTVAIADVVPRESQFVRAGTEGDDEDSDERERVELQPFVATGLLTVIASDDENELLTFLDFSLQVDDGEAKTAAIAFHRQATVITDDRKAIRLLTGHDVVVESTLEILKSCCDQVTASESYVREILTNLQTRARYEPGRGHPYRAWWDHVLGG